MSGITRFIVPPRKWPLYCTHPQSVAGSFGYRPNKLIQNKQSSPSIDFVGLKHSVEPHERNKIQRWSSQFGFGQIRRRKHLICHVPNNCLIFGEITQAHAWATQRKHFLGWYPCEPQISISFAQQKLFSLLEHLTDITSLSTTVLWVYNHLVAVDHAPL